ncbi:hypothetical protein Plec18167_006301 [Paecilomyces lecythidis]|uniref:Integral membrane protein n=1 Tax=Paecilomyces lecythidis TaxID=3004212 RepID=A0ABR3XCU8_9EURO
MEGQNGDNDSKTPIPSERNTELSRETSLSRSSTVDRRPNLINDEAKPSLPTLNVETRMLSECLLDHQSVYVQRKRGTYVPSPNHLRKIRNNLLLGVGFLELANCGDFAANTWNTIPVPKFATVLMAIGGTAALLTSIFAFIDLGLSWMNVRFLQEERAFLRSRKQAAIQHDEEKMEILSQGELDSWLSVNFRELGSELVDRFVMDLLLGTSAVIVGVGALLAIGGANKSIYHASNLLSGYIGNAPGVLFGILNATWTGFLCVRFHRHARAVKGVSLPDTMKDRLTDRFHMMQRHNALSGVSSIVAGAAGMVTATMWWGYVVLIPCIISQISCNYIWRKTIGYDRFLVQTWDKVGHKPVLKKLEDVISVHQLLLEEPGQAVDELISNPESLDSFLQFIFEYDLFDDFCLYLLRHADWRRLFYVESRPDAEFSISPRNLLDSDEQVLSKTLELARSFIIRKSPQHFEYMERFLLEMAGCYVYSHCSAGPEKRTG